MKSNLLVVVLFFALLWATFACCSLVSANALDDYIRATDDVFGYTYTHKHFNVTSAITFYFYNFTSVQWLTPQDTNRPIWNHNLILAVPENVNKSCSDVYLWLTWGRNSKPWEWNNVEYDLDLIILGSTATETGCISAALYDIPNQPIYFYAVNESKSEDSAIAYTFHRYLYEGKGPEWLLYFPMTKSAVKAMDAVEQIVPSLFPGMAVNHFIVSGASKRGWTTWLTGATDYKPGRVKAIIPFVLDALDLSNFLHRQWKSYGGWSFVLKNYWHQGLTTALDSEILYNMSQLVDPFYYRDRLTMPKLAINAVGDEFQLLDDQRHWAHDMPGEMKLLMIQDADHLLVTNLPLVLKGVNSFLQSVTHSFPRPSYNWSIDETTGQITVTTSETPKNVQLIYNTISGYNGRRDFRDTILKETPCYVHVMGGCIRFLLWSQKDVQITPGNNVYQTNVPVPASGSWTGFYLQLTFQSPRRGMEDFVFTSPANVLPLGYPFPPCNGTACKGNLL